MSPDDIRATADVALGTVATGVPLTALAVYIGNNAHWIAWQSKLWLSWVAIALVYAAGGTAILVWNRHRRQRATNAREAVIRQVHPRAGA